MIGSFFHSHLLSFFSHSIVSSPPFFRLPPPPPTSIHFHCRGPQGGAFDKDLDYFRTVLGSNTMIPGLDLAFRTMKVGGIRQVIVPYGPLSYPDGRDKSHDEIGPKPTTFSGMRALNFVLENPRVDRTLLFNVKLIRVDKGDGRGGFVRGS
jgi:hypothetical protein